MQKRIDDFIKVATERNADQAMYRLYQQLVGLCAEDDRRKLQVAWNELHVKKELIKWDEDFLEETINPSPVGQTSMSGTGGSLSQPYNYHPAQQAQSQALAHATNDYYKRQYSSLIGTEKPASYYDNIKSALGL